MANKTPKPVHDKIRKNAMGEDELARALAEQLRGQITVEDLTEFMTEDFSLYENKPIEFIEEVLGLKLTDQQKEVCLSVLDNRNTVVESGHSTGKSTIAAALALWWCSSRKPAAVFTTAPCYDDQTEILTNAGWKYFHDLNGRETVAQLNGQELEFVHPIEYYKFPYCGELIGYKSELVDFLVTPNHKCLVEPFKRNRIITKERPYQGKLIPARDAYGHYGRFSKTANWIGEDTGVSVDFAEFLGFWMAEGYARTHQKSGKRASEVIITNTDDDYVEKLLQRNGLKHTRREKIRSADKIKSKKTCYDFAIYNRDLAEYLSQFGNSHDKFVPTEIKNAKPLIIQSFLSAYMRGDGCIDNNGSRRALTVSKKLADDIQELCFKVGIVANVNYCATGGINNKPRYIINIWQKRGHYPVAQGLCNSYHNWYKQQYDGYVYCVHVPTEIILVRRNGKYVWSGNTWRQVQDILWRYMRQYKRNAKKRLPGEIYETPKWKFDDESSWGSGISTRKDLEGSTGMQGRHNPYLLAIIDEGAGVVKLIWDTVASLATGEKNKKLAIGNPTSKSGEFYAVTQSSAWHSLRLNCLSHPNVVQHKEVVPGAVSWDWVNEMVQNNCQKSDGAGKDDFVWEGQYYRPNPVFMARVLGRPPDESESQLIGYSWVELSQTRWPEVEINGMYQGERVIGLDVARGGDDDTVLTFRIGHHVKEIRRRHGNDINQTIEMLISAINELQPDRVFVDSIGMGSGVVDVTNARGYNITGINSQHRAHQPSKFSSVHDEMWRNVADLLRTGELTIPKESKLETDLVSIMILGYDAMGRPIYEKKEDMKKRLGRSPDAGDSLALTYANYFPESTGATMNINEGLTQSSRWGASESTSRWTVSTTTRRSDSRWKIR